MASIIKADTLQSTTANVFVLNSSGTEYARFDSTGVFQLANNLTFTGTGNRITGDFSNATVASRTAFQNSTANSVTAVGLLPSGTATQSQLVVYNNSDPTNANGMQIFVNATESRLQATNNGTAGYLPMTFYTGGSERLRILAGAPILSLAGGSTTATGTGIAFPATQSASSDANTLDDYEEGTFTPTATGSTVTGTTTYTAQSGFYTKIGRLVTVNINLYWTALTGTGNLLIGGLPFTSSPTTNNFSVGTCMSVGLNFTSGTYVSTFLVNGSAAANIYCSGDDITGNYQGAVNETTELYITLSYTV
jgi:hypothetical protein